MIRANKCDKFSNIAYVALICVLYSYLTYYSIHRYKKFKQVMFDPRFGAVGHEGGMNFYVAMIILGLACLPFIIYTSLLKIGNYASDGETLGKDVDNMAILRDNRGVVSQDEVLLSGPWKRLEKHCLPVGYLCHIISAFCFYLPIPILHAQLIVRTSINNLEMQQRLLECDFSYIFGFDTEPKLQSKYWIESLSVTPEFFNLFCSLIHLSITYPGVFWNTNKLFTFLFSLLMLVASLYTLVDINVAVILHKAAYVTSLYSSSKEYNQYFSITPPYLPANFALGLSVFGSLAILFLFCLVFEYGFSHYQSSLEKMVHNEKCNSNPRLSRQNSTTSSVASGSRKQTSERFCISLSALGLVTIPCFLKATIIWECHQNIAHSIMITNIIFAYFYLVLWILIWMIYLYKTDWIFKVEAPLLPDPCYMTTGSFNNNSTLLGRGNFPNENTDTLQSKSIGNITRERYESTSSNHLYPQVYANEIGSGLQIGSPGMHSPDNYSEETDNSSRTASNYVFLQDAPIPMIPGIMTSSVFDTLPEESEGEKDRSSQISFDTELNNQESPDRPTTGLLKYSVTRSSFRNGQQQLNSVSSSDMEDNSPSNQNGTNSLSRFRKSNRVTFKESPTSILESTQNACSPPLLTSMDGSDNVYIDMKRRRSASVGEVAFFGHNHVGTSADSHTYYNQSQFAAANVNQVEPQHYLRQHSAPPDQQKMTAIGELEQVNLPPRSPFNSLGRAKVKEVAAPQDPRLCSRV